MWRFYIINKVLPITEQVQIVNKIHIAIAALDVSSKTFVLYISIG